MTVCGSALAFEYVSLIASNVQWSRRSSRHHEDCTVDLRWVDEWLAFSVNLTESTVCRFVWWMTHTLVHNFTQTDCRGHVFDSIITMMTTSPSPPFGASDQLNATESVNGEHQRVIANFSHLCFNDTDEFRYVARKIFTINTVHDIIGIKLHSNCY